MRVSLNLVKKYVDLPEKINPKQIAYDLTLRTVEVEGIEDVKEKFNNIVVGHIKEIKRHPNADLLRICITDIGEEKPVQIVCGGSNLYENEYVVVSKPGARVVWHGEGEPVEIKETKMRGEDSYGMICAASEVYLDKFFPASSEKEIVDLKGIKCKSGDNIADVLGLNDVILEIDNKSLTNRPDLWGHYGIARELSAIYEVPLKKMPKLDDLSKLPKYEVEIKDEDKCYRYVAVEMEGLKDIPSPMWMQSFLTNCGMRPINAIVDITNYVMLATGQPTHAFDSTHVEGKKIVVRNAKENEKLLLLDHNEIELTKDDLVICDTKEPMCLAGIRGGAKDSILPETTSVVLEIATFAASTIRKSGKRFDEKTDSSIRYEKNLDTQRIDDCLALAISLFKEIFQDLKIIAFNDVCPKPTQNTVIDVSKEFLDIRLGKELPVKTITNILKALGYEVEYKNKVFHVITPTWRSTGDVSIKDDVLGDIARLLSFESFEAKPLPVNFESAVNEPKVLLERRIKEYLSSRWGFNEIFTYPWIDEKYIKAARIDTSNMIRLATPPAPELSLLRSSLIPGLLEATFKNLRYYDEFRIFEMAQVFRKGEYHESSEDETLPIHNKYLSGAIVGKNAKELFYEAKGIIENISPYVHMEPLKLCEGEKMSWADINAHLDITARGKIIGHIGLVSVVTKNESKIKHSNVAIFELDFDSLVPYPSRTNKFEHLPEVPLVEKDLSLLVDKKVRWQDIEKAINKLAKKVTFIEEYRGNQIPEGMKSIVLRVTIGDDKETLSSEQINEQMNKIIETLDNKCNAKIREE